MKKNILWKNQGETISSLVKIGDLLEVFDMAK